MQKIIITMIKRGLDKQVSATGLGLFRLGFGLVMLQEIVFLLYFSHLIFDEVPFIEPNAPLLSMFLLLWGLTAIHLMIGRFTRYAAIINYGFWIIFSVFTPMWQSFNGGFDLLMISSSFLLIFLPSERSFSIDNLRLKQQLSNLDQRYQPRTQVSVLAYTLPLGISLGLLYFDSAIHKLFAEHWRNGLGGWLPASMPYYISTLDMSWLLNQKLFQQCFGYLILGFQFIFLFTFWNRFARIPLLILGVLFHTSIILVLNIYPFGFAMLIYYFLLVPFSWWRNIKQRLQLKQPRLTVYYDAQCPLCLKAVITIEHFDCLKAIDFKGLQQHARTQPRLDNIPEEQLLKDIYAIDIAGNLYYGVDTYIQIFQKMKYTLPAAYILSLQPVYNYAQKIYRRIADQRERLVCNADTCQIDRELPTYESHSLSGYKAYTRTPRQCSIFISKFLILVLFLQLNVTIHYGLIYRIAPDLKQTSVGSMIAYISDTIGSLSHTFLGISPHALYLHDHFEGYNHILAFTYKDDTGEEKWLPFVNQQGRIVAPNWGRVQSMWANIAVTPNIDEKRLHKFTQKITAFWGVKEELDLNDTIFTIKTKRVKMPSTWEKNLREYNMTQQWQDVGTVTWKDKRMYLDIAMKTFQAPVVSH